jgi:2-iminobutanoate/2-iminopropanoate deaminase
VHSLVLSAGFPLPQATVEAEIITQVGPPTRRFVVAGPFDDAGRIPCGADPAAQTGHALDALVRTLSEAGNSLRDVVMLRMTLADIRDLSAVEGTCRRTFAAPYPACTVVGAPLAHPDQLIELEAIVVKGGGQPVGGIQDTLGCASPAMLAGDYLYISAQRAPAGATVDTQTRFAWNQIDALLAMADMRIEDVIHTTNVLTDWRSYGGFNAGYGAHAHPPYPPRATVQGDLSEPRALVQIEAIAHRHGRDATFINVPGAG